MDRLDPEIAEALPDFDPNEWEECEDETQPFSLWWRLVAAGLAVGFALLFYWYLEENKKRNPKKPDEENEENARCSNPLKKIEKNEEKKCNGTDEVINNGENKDQIILKRSSPQNAENFSIPSEKREEADAIERIKTVLNEINEPGLSAAIDNAALEQQRILQSSYFTDPSPVVTQEVSISSTNRIGRAEISGIHETVKTTRSRSSSTSGSIPETPDVDSQIQLVHQENTEAIRIETSPNSQENTSESNVHPESSEDPESVHDSLALKAKVTQQQRDDLDVFYEMAKQRSQETQLLGESTQDLDSQNEADEKSDEAVILGDEPEDEPDEISRAKKAIQAFQKIASEDESSIRDTNPQGSLMHEDMANKSERASHSPIPAIVIVPESPEHSLSSPHQSQPEESLDVEQEEISNFDFDAPTAIQNRIDANVDQIEDEVFDFKSGADVVMKKTVSAEETDSIQLQKAQMQMSNNQAEAESTNVFEKDSGSEALDSSEIEEEYLPSMTTAPEIETYAIEGLDDDIQEDLPEDPPEQQYEQLIEKVEQYPESAVACTSFAADEASERKVSLLEAAGVTSAMEALMKIKTLEEVSNIMRKAGLKSSNLIFGIDYTASNKYQGEFSFNGESLHSIRDGIPNPYQQVITIMGKTLAPFATSGYIPAFGFGDVTTSDWSVFPLNTESYCKDFDEVLDRYNSVTPTVILSGPTNFAPLIVQSMEICRKVMDYHILVIVADGQVTNERATRRAIVDACAFPMSIIVVGVGDGPWDMMKVFDESLPKRTWDNFHFVEFHSILKAAGPSSDLSFAIQTLLEIPDQYKQIKKLGLIKSTPPLEES